MIKKKMLVTSPVGLQMRLAGEFCDAAVSFESSITFSTEGSYEGNAKSILSILGGCVGSGETIEVCCDGPDEEIAMKKIEEIFNS